MIRLTGAIACGIVAFDCAMKATGEMPQTLFSQEHAGVWWVVVFFWTVNALALLLGL